MDQARWDRIQTLFQRAIDIPASEQHDFLRTACDGDDVLMDEVLAMLSEDARGTSLLDGDLPSVADAMLRGVPPSFTSTEFGTYRIKKLLGEGGMGVVYLAERQDIGSVVAIKLLRDAFLSPARVERFVIEQKTLAKLEHPFIAAILDAGALADGTPWFVMPYVEGTPLTEYCRVHECSIAEQLRLVRAVSEAVQYAHSQAIIHRDLKPSNILVKADGTVRLLDFGIAKQMESAEPADRTQTIWRAMTLSYAAPEQIRGERLGTQVDVYSLGVILYELLTGKLPFDLSNLSHAEAEQTILQHEVQAPSSVAKGSSELDVLCLTAMHKDVTRRYQSVEALIRDIDHYLKSEPLEARPDTLGYRLRKFVRRNRRVLSAALAAGAIVAALVIFFVVRLARARTTELSEARRTHRIERFMLNLFDGGDKAAGPSGSLQAVTLLDRGVESARTLRADPAVQADLYQTLGNMYQKLGKSDQADKLLRSALERRKSIAGPDNQEVADGLVALGLLRLDQSQVAEAERLIREGLAMDQRHLPPNDPSVLRAESAMGRVLEDRGAYDEAVKTLDETVRLQSAQKEITTDLSDSITELATAHYYLGHLNLADSLNQRALAIDRQLFGAVHPRVADDLYNLGLIQHDLGHDAAAEQNYRQALAIKQAWYGTEHPDTALIMAAVGQALIYQHRYDEAAPVLEQALAIQERLFGKVHAQVAMGLNVLGMLELKRGHLSDAEKDFLRMADINRSVYDDRHYLVGIALLGLGEVYLEEKNTARAEHSYREALARFTEKLPANHPNTAVARIRLGHTLVLERQYKEAEGLLLAGYTVLEKQPGQQAARIQVARQDLVTVYEALKQPEKAAKFRVLAASSAKR
ncbi:MAG TPA: serine/threonine-protein kinase [Bryobacteraceae bacterium]|nr:serine/threonine-protein kinase [Bryobacteraceae bacterium]